MAASAGNSCRVHCFPFVRLLFDCFNQEGVATLINFDSSIHNYCLQIIQADARVGQFLTAAIAMGYLYQGPPFRLSYQGLGEPLCFMAFGPLATTAFYLAQVRRRLRL